MFLPFVLELSAVFSFFPVSSCSKHRVKNTSIKEVTRWFSMTLRQPELEQLHWVARWDRLSSVVVTVYWCCEPCCSAKAGCWHRTPQILLLPSSELFKLLEHGCCFFEFSHVLRCILRPCSFMLSRLRHYNWCFPCAQIKSKPQPLEHPESIWSCWMSFTCFWSVKGHKVAKPPPAELDQLYSGALHFWIFLDDFDWRSWI